MNISGSVRVAAAALALAVIGACTTHWKSAPPSQTVQIDLGDFASTGTVVWVRPYGGTSDVPVRFCWRDLIPTGAVPVVVFEIRQENLIETSGAKVDPTLHLSK